MRYSLCRFSHVALTLMAWITMSSASVADNKPGWQEKPVNIGALHGTLMLPAMGKTPYDTALILPGSGPTDRNGNFPEGRNDSLKLLAEGLAKEGIASLRIDKRGIGESIGAAPSEDELRAETYVTDAAQWIDFLKKRGETGRIFLIGHSEGAFLATLVAAKRDISGLVLIAGTGRKAGDLLREQLNAGSMDAELKETSLAIIEALERGEMVSSVPGQLFALFRPSVQPYLISWFKYDPAEELKKLSLPVLLIHGTHDLQIANRDAELLAAAAPHADVLKVEGMNHVMKISPADRSENIRLYSNPNVPIAPVVVERISKFIHATK